MLWDGDTPCPLVGRVSMDMITVDVTHLPEVPKDAGHPLGPHQTVDDLADAGRHHRLRDPDRRSAPAITAAIWNPAAEALDRLSGRLGRPVLAVLAAVGRVAIYAATALGHLLRPPFYWREFGQAVMQIGWFSLPVVGLTAIFTGGALALQIYAGGSRASTPRPWCRRSSPSAWRANWARCWAG
jgi:hypothetical protein